LVLICRARLQILERIHEKLEGLEVTLKEMPASLASNQRILTHHMESDISSILVNTLLKKR
jgi:hypothetical protein